MNRASLIAQIKEKKNFLCIGLDSDWEKLPKHILETEDPIFEFNKAIINATHDCCVAYKPNTAFYENRGSKGWQSLEKTIHYLNVNYPNHFTIADAKRGDIGNTSRLYAKAFFESMNFDSVTVAPYMGEDSITPFLTYPGKWAIVLALTSNKGAEDFQLLQLKESKHQLFEQTLIKCKQWGTQDNMMFVVGATRPSMLAEIRKLVPDHFLLVPGVGAQGGSLDEVVKYGRNADIGLLVNASRSILFAGSEADFADHARLEALKLHQEMNSYF